MIKLKSIFVIIFSSIVISAVILVTILAIPLYIGWKERESVANHRDRIARLNATLYGPFITVKELKAEYAQKDVIKDKCVLEGVIKNTGFRTVGSLGLEVEFLNKSGDVIYIEKFYPLKASLPPQTRTIATLALFASGKEQPLLPNSDLRFKQVLSEQKEKAIVSPIKYKRYATNPNEWSGELKSRVTHIKF